jgi:hypothetical protein
MGLAMQLTQVMDSMSRSCHDLLYRTMGHINISNARIVPLHIHFYDYIYISSIITVAMLLDRSYQKVQHGFYFH